MNLLQQLEAEQMAGLRAKKLPEFRPGDTLKVNVKVVDVTYDEKTKQQSARTVLQNIKILAVGRQLGAPPADGTPQPATNNLTFLVTPGQARQGRTAGRYLGDFHKGWICFEALESNARRRLPRQPERWTELQDPDLCQLLAEAITAPQRKRQREAGVRPPTPPAH